MAQTHTKTAIAFQGGGALGAFALGALRKIYEAEPDLRPSCVSGVSIGAFTAAIVASHPDDPVSKLEAFWDDISVFHSALLPPHVEKVLAIFGNRGFYWPRWDFTTLPYWDSFYDIEPVMRTLRKYVDFATIDKAEVKLAVTATDIASGEIMAFSNVDPTHPLTMDHLVASGSLPPSYPAEDDRRQRVLGRRAVRQHPAVGTARSGRCRRRGDHPRHRRQPVSQDCGQSRTPCSMSGTA